MRRHTLPLIAATALITSVALAATRPHASETARAETSRAELRAAGVHGSEPDACWRRYKLSPKRAAPHTSPGWLSRWSEQLLSGAGWIYDSWAESVCPHAGEEPTGLHSFVLPGCPDADLG